MKHLWLLLLASVPFAVQASAESEKVLWPRLPEMTKVECNLRNADARAVRDTPQREEAQDIDIRLKVDYDHEKYNYMQVLCVNDFWSYVVDEVDLMSDGYLHVSDTPGTYQFIAIFTHADFNGVTYVIRENVDVSDSTPVVLDVYSATNHIKFRPVTPAGLPMEGMTFEGDETVAEGDILSGIILTYLYHKRFGELTRTFANCHTTILDGIPLHGQQEGDVYVNDIPDDSEFRFVQARMGRNSSGAFVTKLEADGAKSQTITNTADSYIKTIHTFGEHAYGNRLLQNIPSIKSTETFGYIPVWNGILEKDHMQNVMYYITLDNPTDFYISAPPSTSTDMRFDLLPYFGTYDEANASGSGFEGMGFGCATPPMQVTADGHVKLLHNAAVNGFCSDEWLHAEDDFEPRLDAFSDYLSSTIDNGVSSHWNNSAPICVASVGYRKNADSRLKFSFVGRGGENRPIDYRNTDFEMKADGEVICTRIHNAQGDFLTWRLRGGEFNPTAAEYKITISNNNVLVDGIPGYNKTSIYYDANFSLPCPPALRSLQFRDSEGNVTDRLKENDGVLEFYAGDFEYASGEKYGQYWFNYVNLGDVTVEYAPRGSGQWRTLDVEEVPEMLRERTYGAFYRAPLSDLAPAGDDGWYDLRIKLTDNSDNYQTQEISPAFKIVREPRICAVTLDVNYDLPAAQSLNGLFAYESTGADKQVYHGLSEDEDGHVYEFNMPEGRYDFFVGVDLDDMQGYAALTLDDVEVRSDMTLNLNASDATWRTDIKHIAPDGSIVRPGQSNSSGAILTHNVMHNDLLVLNAGMSTNHDAWTYILSNNPDSRYKMTRLDMLTSDNGTLNMIIPVDCTNAVSGSNTSNWQSATVPIAETKPWTQYKEYMAANGKPDYYYTLCPSLMMVDGRLMMTAGVANFNATCPSNTVAIWQPEEYDGPFSVAAIPVGSAVISWQSEVSALPLVRSDEGLRQLGANVVPYNSIFLATQQSAKIGPEFDAFVCQPTATPLGNCVPLLMLTPYDEYFNFTFSGRHGESIGYAAENYFIPSEQYWEEVFDGNLCDLKFYRDSQLICDRRNDFPYDCDWGTGGKFRLEITANGVLVDGTVEGFSKSVSEFDTQSGSWISPTLTSLRIVDADGSINDRLEQTEGSYIALTGGLFNYVGNNEEHYAYADFEPVECTAVEYAPYGTEDFIPLSVNEVGQPILPGFGNLFHASLATVKAEDADRWYDLRISIRDSHGATQTQTLSPAFMVKGLSEIESVSVENIDINSCEIYTLQGIRINMMQEHGVYIVRTPDGRTFKVSR